MQSITAGKAHPEQRKNRLAASAATGATRRRLSPTRLAGRLWSVFRALLLIGISFIIIYPLLVQISQAFMHPDDMYDLTVHWIPRRFTMMNVNLAYDLLNYSKAFLNTLLVATGLSLLELMSCMVIGYGFARFKFRGSGLLFGLVIFTLIVPPQMIMVPLFLNFRFFTFLGLLEEPGINLLGSAWPMVLMALTGTAKRNGLFIYIARQYFRGMSGSLEEAAYVDGAGPLRTFFQIMLPNAVPVAVVIFLFAFVWQWNDLFYTDLFMKGRELLPLALQQLHDQYSLPWSPKTIEGTYSQLVLNAGMLLYIAPLLLLYACLQRYFIESIEKTGIVG